VRDAEAVRVWAAGVAACIVASARPAGADAQGGRFEVGGWVGPAFCGNSCSDYRAAGIGAGAVAMLRPTPRFSAGLVLGFARLSRRGDQTDLATYLLGFRVYPVVAAEWHVFAQMGLGTGTVADTQANTRGSFAGGVALGVDRVVEQHLRLGLLLAASEV